ncbi:acyl-CoA thioesterase [Rhodobacteraceae bacterium HSP-20]|uniref:Acyl-CoA thioesterase n=1 Tax=Paragemmobacter amnigenus TaxID=2852097 RepID=A0ABS6J7D4_9RHOB|nr:thioesterase family protein [Rhodobacter amnigenus]MBU9699668.1 acyl-CoA thioesterase [Rhodobacter amnigenus]MBV4390895.1 acyl-CoA thioesterase [Rhodobacter amnigenus]
MSYARAIRIEFNHCDPAGIVFYPRYFEMTNSVCENFFREVVGYSYHAMMADGIGTPTARVETDFRAPSRLGDVLDWLLVVEKVGGSSVTFRLEARCGDEHRLTARLVLVWLTPEMRPGRWPDRIRAVFEAHLEERP